MNKWEFEDLLSEETKINIKRAWLEDFQKDFKDDNPEEYKDYINEELGNSYWEMLKELFSI